MSTHAMIYIKYYDPNMPMFKGIYCHFDGYLTYTGEILESFYNSTEKVEKLISNGNIAGFNEDGFPEKMEDSDEKFSTYLSENDMPKYIDFHYVWDTAEEKWYFSEWENKDWKELSF